MKGKKKKEVEEEELREEEEEEDGDDRRWSFKRKISLEKKRGQKTKITVEISIKNQMDGML